MDILIPVVLPLALAALASNWSLFVDNLLAVFYFWRQEDVGV